MSQPRKKNPKKNLPSIVPIKSLPTSPPSVRDLSRGTRMKNLVVGLTGLPSAGKSTLINSIVGKRILRSGVCRTTLDVHMIGAENKFNFPEERFHQHNVVDDDGNPITFLDLPGVADAENKGTEINYDEMTQAWITQCDIILWVSDITTAFLTTHEMKEFTKIHETLKRNSLETGTFYHVAVLLTKCNFCDRDQTVSVTENPSDIKSSAAAYEIESDDEETTLEDCVVRVGSIFDKYDESIPILKFNAFGRIFHQLGSSYQLVKMVKKTTKGAFDTNTAFSLQFAVDQHEAKQQLQLLISLREHHFKQSPLNKENIMETYAKITDPSTLERLMFDLIDSTDPNPNPIVPSATALEIAKIIGYSQKMEKVYDAIKEEIKYNKHAFNCLIHLVGGKNVRLNREMLEFHFNIQKELKKILDVYAYSQKKTEVDMKTFYKRRASYYRTDVGGRTSERYFQEFNEYICDEFPMFADLDRALMENPWMACTTKFLARVRDQRLALWGVSNEKDVLTFMIINLFMKGVIPSMFVKICPDLIK